MMTIDNFYQDKLEINKSKFLSFAYHISSEKNCKEYLLDLKNKFSDATHICYGYILSCPKIEKCSDDGEPSGTAGKPILELLKKKKLENVLIAVVRYFGGKKLGAGGLIRAYTNSAKQVLDSANVVEFVSMKKCSTCVSLASGDRTKKEIEANGGKITSINYSDVVRIEFQIADIDSVPSHIICEVKSEDN